MKKTETGLIVDITEIFAHKTKKEEELRFYQKELEKLQFRMSMVQREIDVTETIIGMIEEEKVVDLIDLMAERRNKL